MARYGPTSDDVQSIPPIQGTYRGEVRRYSTVASDQCARSRYLSELRRKQESGQDRKWWNEWSGSAAVAGGRARLLALELAPEKLSQSADSPPVDAPIRAAKQARAGQRLDASAAVGRMRSRKLKLKRSAHQAAPGDLRRDGKKGANGSPVLPPCPSEVTGVQAGELQSQPATALVGQVRAEQPQLAPGRFMRSSGCTQDPPARFDLGCLATASRPSRHFASRCKRSNAGTVLPSRLPNMPAWRGTYSPTLARR